MTRLHLKDAWIDVRPGVRLAERDGVLVFEPDTETIAPPLVAPELLALPPPDDPSDPPDLPGPTDDAPRPIRRRANKTAVQQQKNKVVLKYLAEIAASEPDRFLRMAELFTGIVPGVPTRINGQTRREYTDLANTIYRLAKAGRIEVKPNAFTYGAGRYIQGYRLARD